MTSHRKLGVAVISDYVFLEGPTPLLPSNVYVYYLLGSFRLSETQQHDNIAWGQGVFCVELWKFVPLFFSRIIDYCIYSINCPPLNKHPP